MAGGEGEVARGRMIATTRGDVRSHGTQVCRALYVHLCGTRVFATCDCICGVCPLCRLRLALTDVSPAYRPNSQARSIYKDRVDEVGSFFNRVTVTKPPPLPPTPLSSYDSATDTETEVRVYVILVRVGE